MDKGNKMRLPRPELRAGDELTRKELSSEPASQSALKSWDKQVSPSENNLL